jgi:hypothetical protein
MRLFGVIPDVPDTSSAKRVLKLMGKCPECGGQGWTAVSGYDTPPFQEACLTCYIDEVFGWMEWSTT